MRFLPTHPIRSLLATVAVVLCAATASAASDSCREWQQEHKQWMTRAVSLYLHGAPQAELDGAVFEILQRESYLTSCDLPVEKARSELAQIDARKTAIAEEMGEIAKRVSDLDIAGEAGGLNLRLG